MSCLFAHFAEKNSMMFDHTHQSCKKNGLGLFIPLCIVSLCSIFGNRTSGSCFRAGRFFMVKKCRLTMSYSHESNSIRSLMSSWISFVGREQKPPEILLCPQVYFNLLVGFTRTLTRQRLYFMHVYFDFTL